jgi:hypothetical protein
MTVRTLPLFPLGSVLFPEGPLSLRIFEPRYVDMVSRCLRDNTGFVVLLLVQGREAGAGATQAAAIGTEARIVDFDRLDDGLLGLTCVGVERVHVLKSWRQEDGLHVGEVEDIAPDLTCPVALECSHLPPLLRQVFGEVGEPYASMRPRYDDAGWVANRLAEIAPLEPNVRQRLLEMRDPAERLAVLGPMIRPGRTDA